MQKFNKKYLKLHIAYCRRALELFIKKKKKKKKRKEKKRKEKKRKGKVDINIV